MCGREKEERKKAMSRARHPWHHRPLSLNPAGACHDLPVLAAACRCHHPQPFHAYVMGIPGIKICTASSPEAAYGITKSMIRDNGPGILFCPVKMMKGVKGAPELGRCLPLNKAAVLHAASDEAVSEGRVSYYSCS